MIERGDNFRQVKGDTAWHVMQMPEVKIRREELPNKEPEDGDQ